MFRARSKTVAGPSRLPVRLLAGLAVVVGVGLHFAAGQEVEVPRPGAAQPAEVPRPGFAQPAAQATSGPVSATAQPTTESVNRELLKVAQCGITCHFNEAFAQQIAKMNEAMLVQYNFMTSGPVELARPRPADYMSRVVFSRDKYLRTLHGKYECIDCHKAIAKIPHPQYIAPATCDPCHVSEQQLWEQGTHGKAVAKKDLQAPTCGHCHRDYHETVATTSALSSVYRLAISKTCATCHADPAVLANHTTLKADAVETYLKTIHGEGIHRSGIPGSATCADCHGPHRNLNHLDAASSTSARNTVPTCGACHVNDATSYTASIHCVQLFAGAPTAPGCADCHPGHETIRTNTEEFQLDSIKKCGACHPDQYATYLETYHGKVAEHRGLNTARCRNCHDNHDIQYTTVSLSLVSPGRIVETCKQCHSYSNEKFTQFIAHLEPSDPTYPQTYYPWLFMTLLLVGTMGFFVVHSFFWLIRELADLPKRKAKMIAEGQAPPYRIQRFNLTHRLTHAILFVSVIGLAATGLPLRYSATGWGQWMFDHLFGGHLAPRILHRIFAALTILYAGMHFAYLWNLWRRAPKQPWLKRIFGPASMIPNWTDVKQFFQHARWFFFMGPMPRFGRWTYWEKFDYWAVFWGVAIIGASGAVMALPWITARFLPGWVFNVALIIHSDEALLAASFLFAIHFFHVHLRPEKFPIDHVIFSGSIAPHEMAAERPLELEQLQAEGRLEALRMSAPNPVQLIVNRVIAAVTLLIGLALLVGMFWTEIVARLF